MKLVERICLVYSNREENSNKFYIVEVQEDEDKKVYNLITKYGRLGKKPQKQIKEFKNKAIAILAMNQKANKKKYSNNPRYTETDIDSIIANGDLWWD